MTNQLKFCYKTDQCIALNYFIHNNDKMKSTFVSRLIILSVVFAETYGMYERILLLYNVTFTFVERFQFHFSSKSVPFMIIKSSIHVFTFFTYNSSNCILIQLFFFGKAYDADAIVQAACAASSTGGFVSAIRRTCGGTQATCDAICGSAISGMRDIYGNQGSTTYVSINLFVFNRKRDLIFFYFDISLPNIVLGEKCKCSA